MEAETSLRNSLVGQTLDNRYQIESVIGEGGMSTVYKARHLFLNRTVAVKLMQEHLSTEPESLKRFQREAQALAALSHPNIVGINEFGISDGQPYMVMDFLPGQSLADLLRQKYKCDPNESLSIFLQIGAALIHAHHKNVLHRDLKPSNVMLFRNSIDNALQVKVVDLGLARFIPHDKDTLQSRLTAAGELVGSPFYMSPEQIRDESLDARSDIYSMGCLMYETLTGTRPFNDSNPITVLSMHLYDPPPPFSAVMADNKIPPKMEAIVFKCLEKSRSKRYQSMTDLVNDLNKVPDWTADAKRPPEKAILQASAAPAPAPEKAPMPIPKLPPNDGRQTGQFPIARSPLEKSGTVDLRAQYTLRLKKPEENKLKAFLSLLKRLAEPLLSKARPHLKKVFTSFEGSGPEARRYKVNGSKVLICSLGDSKELTAAAEADAAKYSVYYKNVELRKTMTAPDFIVLLSTENYDIIHLHGHYDKSGTFNDATGFTMRMNDVRRACDFAKVKLLWLASDNDSTCLRENAVVVSPSVNLIMTSARGENFPKFLSSLLSRLSRGEFLSSAWSAYVPYVKYKGDRTECKFVQGTADVAFLP